MNHEILPLDPEKRSTDTLEFKTALASKIVGQEEGVQALVDLYQVFCAGLNSPASKLQRSAERHLSRPDKFRGIGADPVLAGPESAWGTGRCKKQFLRRDPSEYER